MRTTSRKCTRQGRSMSKPVILFIVEGKSRDCRFVKEMTTCFFKGHYSSKIICLPAAQNLYMLYQKLEEDDFETDVVEVLKETVKDARIELSNIKRQEISEVYLFFDFDVHQNNTSDAMPCDSEIMKKMLKFFDNETENGRLYISYPMVEALYDYRDGTCKAFSNCYVSLKSCSQYKNLSGENNPKACQRMDIAHWHEILNVFSLRVQCLFKKSTVDLNWYRETVSPESIYNAEREIFKRHNSIFVLSAFPEFLFDNFKEEFWNSMSKQKNKKFNYCRKK